MQKIPGLKLVAQLPDQDPVVGIIVWHDRVFIAGKHSGIYEYFESEPGDGRLKPVTLEDIDEKKSYYSDRFYRSKD